MYYQINIINLNFLFIETSIHHQGQYQGYYVHEKNPRYQIEIPFLEEIVFFFKECENTVFDSILCKNLYNLFNSSTVILKEDNS